MGWQYCWIRSAAVPYLPRLFLPSNRLRQGQVTQGVQPAKTLWDWLGLLVVPPVLAIGGYLFARSENQRMRENADRQRTLDRELADERRQDDILQAYLDGMSQLLSDKERPLHRAELGDHLSTVARARTITVLSRLDAKRKGSLIQFLYEAGLINRGHPLVSLTDADLRGADLYGATLRYADLSEAWS